MGFFYIGFQLSVSQASASMYDKDLPKALK